ncbi:tRNA pseudouridine(38-40) synthase TruA [Tropicimonas isoalkanivorans]|uniref:tRNA pseudouridine synthase A n=1 Tax=Tropicimonas isoalkanivorans TaxID=441112 RepID=A0A1I1N9T3_9RHOB|nr:tRNA pseudouridine(38-40) synthase TruA [Tropicimonas isoalkanivorans]SFC92228.1 tRNA pseudouridine38-40 synthase [Tropicimonas isoalkanivorans]
MPRYALKIEYNGAPFSGWQRQKEHPSVQQAIETAISRLQQQQVTIAAAGRTDAGVHALAQVAHVDMARAWDPFRLSEALNYHLKPSPVAILAAAPVSGDWHARFSAHERRYLFRLLPRRAPAALLAGKVWQVAHPLRIAPMQEAARYLLGRHDFTTFRATECQADSPVRTLDQLDIEWVETPLGPEIHFYVRARSFLHNQVRSFVGTLERVGAGAWTPEDVRRALQAKDRAACGPVCPPHGLYLSGVGYVDNPFDRPSEP